MFHLIKWYTETKYKLFLSEFHVHQHYFYFYRSANYCVMISERFSNINIAINVELYYVNLYKVEMYFSILRH